MWYFRTIDGLWTICAHEERFVLMFNGEYLAEGGSPVEILKRVPLGAVAAPRCGLDPAAAGLPRRIENWSLEAPRRMQRVA